MADTLGENHPDTELNPAETASAGILYRWAAVYGEHRPGNMALYRHIVGRASIHGLRRQAQYQQKAQNIFIISL